MNITVTSKNSHYAVLQSRAVYTRSGDFMS